MRFSSCFGILTICCVFAGGQLASANPDRPPDLKLNDLTWTHHSKGIRSYNLVDVYRCILYLPDREDMIKNKSAESIKSLEYPVALRIEMLTSMLPESMPEAWRETLEPEVTGKAFHRFREGFASLDEGDVLLFMYMPGESTRLFLNDELVFKDPGRGLMQGLLEQWIGTHPISEDLKQALIGE